MKVPYAIRKLILSLLLLFQISCQSQDEAFFKALTEKQYYTCEKHLASGKIDPEYKNKQGQTAMHIAVASGDLEMVYLLLRNNYSLTVKDASGKYPADYAPDFILARELTRIINEWFCNASYKGNIQIAGELLDAGADINYLGSDIGPPLHETIIGDQYEMFLFLIKKGADINKRNYRGETILHYAVHYPEENTYDFVEKILSMDFNVNLKSIDGWTPIFYLTPDPEVTRLLIEHGAKINITNKAGNTPLHMIMRDDAIETVKILMENGANPEIKNDEGNTPLHLTGNFNCRKGVIVAYLLSKGANIKARNKYGLTPLHCAASGVYDNGSTNREAFWSEVNEKGVELLIKAGANVHALDARGRTPLHYAAECGSIDSCRRLLKAGAVIHV